MTDIVLALDGLQKRFGAITVLTGISANVHRGEVIGLLGLNGAGKTTLLETALGFALPNAGSVKLFECDSSALTDDNIKQRIGFVPQQDELIAHMKGREYLDLIGQFYPKWNQSLIERLTIDWDIPPDVRIGSLSVGQRQKLSILSALGHEPELIILDEPVASLDPVARRLFLKELIDLTSDGERTVLFSTHIVSDLERIASRIWLLKQGTLHIDESLDSLKERTVRIQLPPGTHVPAGIHIDGLLHQRKQHETSTLVLGNWNATQQAALEDQLKTTVEPVHLSLEDIFLELHA